MEPTNTSGPAPEVTFWVDAETYFPVRATTGIEDGEQEYEVDVRFRNVSLNEPISEDRFTIDIPADAEEPDHSVPEVRTYDSLSTLRDETSRSVPEPAVPDAYAFEQGHVVDGDDYRSVALRYTSDEGRLHVVKRPPTEYEHDGETTASVVLPCADNTYSVSGDLPKEETVETAEIRVLTPLTDRPRAGLTGVSRSETPLGGSFPSGLKEVLPAPPRGR